MKKKHKYLPSNASVATGTHIVCITADWRSQTAFFIPTI